MLGIMAIHNNNMGVIMNVASALLVRFKVLNPPENLFIQYSIELMITVQLKSYL